MDNSTFLLEISTPKKIIVKEDDISYLHVPGKSGNLGVLPDHSPLLTCLDTGAAFFETISGNKSEIFFISGGFIEISQDQVNILADIVEWQSEIDINRAKESQIRAQERLSKKKQDDIVDITRAEIALKKALWRINVKNGLLS